MAITGFFVLVSLIFTVLAILSLVDIACYKKLKICGIMFILLLEASFIFIILNISSTFIPEGYAGYVRTKPLLSQPEFKGIVIGASNMGLKWRTEVKTVSLFPYTRKGTVEGIQTRDGDIINFNISVVYSIKKDHDAIRKFFETYAGLNNKNRNPNDIVRTCYSEFISPALNMIMQDIIFNYNTSDIRSHLHDISNIAKDNLNQYLESSPFVINAIVVRLSIKE